MKNAMSKRVVALVMIGSMMGTTVVQAAEVKKDESVYVNLGSDGRLDKTTVSDWIHSDENNVTVFDKSELKNIKNVKSDLEPDKSGENLIWDMEGSDLYYQGTTDKDIPLDISVKYYYEDEEIDPEDLAGKSGKIKIEIDVKNKEFKEVEINGKKRKVYTPFMVAGEITLPNDKFSAVTTDGATMISEGNNILVAFAKMPGLSESLELNSIPYEKVTEMKDKVDVLNDKKIIVEADAEEFSLGPIMITATPDTSMLGDLDGAENVTELKNKLDLMQSSYNQILDGETQINDGIVNGYSELNAKVSESASKFQGMLGLVKNQDQVNRSRILLNDAYAAKKMDTSLLRSSLDYIQSPEVTNYINKEVQTFRYLNDTGEMNKIINTGREALNQYGTINNMVQSTRNIVNNKEVMGQLSLLLNDIAALEKNYDNLNSQTKQVLNIVSSSVTLENINAIENTVSQLTPVQEALKAAVKNAGGTEKFISSLRTALATLGALSQIDFSSISTDINNYGSAYLILRAELMASASSTEKLEAKKMELKQIVSSVYATNSQLVSQLTQAIDSFSKNLTPNDIKNDCIEANKNAQTLQSLAQGVQTLQALGPLLGQLNILTSDTEKFTNVLNILTGNNEVISQLETLVKAIKGLPQDQQLALINMVGNLGTIMSHVESNKENINAIKSIIGNNGLSQEDITKINEYADLMNSAEDIFNNLKAIEIPNIDMNQVNNIIPMKDKLVSMSNELIVMQDHLRGDEDILKIMNDALAEGNINEARNMLNKLPDYKSQLDELSAGIQELSSGMQRFKNEAVDELYNKGTDGFNTLDELSLAKDEIMNASREYGCFSGKDDSVNGSTKFIMKTKEIKYEAPKEDDKKEETTEKKGLFAWLKSLLGLD